MAGSSILLVDDDDDFRTAASRALRAAGYAVDEAANGTQGLGTLLADRPDLLITDRFMPASDGIELVSEAKRMAPSVRILAISGRRFMGAVDLLHMMERLGADATLDKPFDAEQLVAKVAELIGPPPALRAAR